MQPQLTELAGAGSIGEAPIIQDRTPTSANRLGEERMMQDQMQPNPKLRTTQHPDKATAGLDHRGKKNLLQQPQLKIPSTT